MAVTYQSTQTASDTNTTVTVTKPTSTAEGDLLIGSFWYEATGRTVTPPSGWTLHESGGTNQDCYVYSKVAGGSEPADYTWSVDGATVDLQASVTRITGQSSVSPVHDTSSDDATVTGTTGTLTYTYSSMAITPPNSTSNLILFYTFDRSSSTVGSTSSAGYAIANDNPTWTERFDQNIGASTTNVVALATAARPEQTSTGDFTSTSTLHSSGAAGFAVAVLVIQDLSVNVSGTTGTITLVGNDGSVSGDANIAGTTGTITLTGNDGTVTTPASDWTNQDKTDSNPTITNQAKS